MKISALFQKLQQFLFANINRRVTTETYYQQNMQQKSHMQ